MPEMPCPIKLLKILLKTKSHFTFKVNAYNYITIHIILKNRSMTEINYEIMQHWIQKHNWLLSG